MTDLRKDEWVQTHYSQDLLSEKDNLLADFKRLLMDAEKKLIEQEKEHKIIINNLYELIEKKDKEIKILNEYISGR